MLANKLNFSHDGVQFMSCFCAKFQTYSLNAYKKIPKLLEFIEIFKSIYKDKSIYKESLPCFENVFSLILQIYHISLDS